MSGLPVGLSFDAPSRTISGSPSLIGASVVTVTVTDNGGATAQTSFSLQVLGNNTSTPPAATTTTAPPTTTVTTPANPLTLLAPTVDCATGLLTFRTGGGDGTLIEYFAVGLRPWGSSPTATLESWLPDGVVFTLQARQSGKLVSRDYTTNCRSLTVTPPVAANKAPVVVAAIASQTATLARSYSLVIPPGTFTDPDGQLVSWAVSGLPVGLSFDAPSRTISGSPSLIGASVVTVTVTDNGGATAQTSFSLQVLGNNTSTPPAPIPPALTLPEPVTVTVPSTTTAPPTTTPANPLTLLAPTVDCATGLLTFRTGGGDGTLIEYFAVGLRPWSSSPTATLESWLPDGVVFTLQARQSGKLVSRDYITNCRSLTVTPPVAANKAPVVVAAIASQTATLARSYSLVIPPGTFTDPDGQLVSWAVSGLPVGLSFDAPSRTISGSPSLIGASVVTVTVTDNGGATAQTSFSLQVLGNNTSTPPAATTTTAPPTTTTVTTTTALTLLAPTVDCATGLLTFRTGGGDGTLIEYFAVGLRPWSSSPTATLESWLPDGVVFTLQARQSGKLVSRDYITNCRSLTVTPPVAANKAPVVVAAIASQTATLARSYSLVIPPGTFTDPDGQLVSWAVSGLPVGLSFDAPSRTISGSPSLIGASVVTVTVTDNGGATAQTSFSLQVLGNNTPTPPAATTATAPPTTTVTTPANPLTLLAPTVDCATGLLTFRTGGGDGTLIEYFAVGLRPWSSSPTATLESWLPDGVVFTLQARQSGKLVSRDYTTNCRSLTVTPPVTTTPVTPTTPAPPTTTNLVVVSPQNRIVYQRNKSNQANVPVIGQAPVTATRAEARLVPVVAGQGTLLDWTNVPLLASNTFATRLTNTGGWYRLEVRTWNGAALLSQQTIDRVGIGEVFVVAGQSNAYGGFEVRPGANDDRVSCVDYFDDAVNEAALPMQFSHMDISVSAGPSNPKHIWPELGDKLTNRLNVPVLFLGAAQSSTTSEQWRQSADGSGTPFPNQFPYRRLGATLLHYIARTGARAVLWHQGEGDQGKTTQSYVDNITTVINKSRQQLGNNALPWVVSRTTYVRAITDPNIINAQNRLANELPQVYPGPETDVLGAAYRLVDNVHIAGPGATRFVEMWDQSLSTDFFAQSVPVTPGETPQITTGYALPIGSYYAGQTISVPYVVSGNSDNTNSFSVQLIRDADGSIVTTLGSGRSNPMSITLPGTLANGTYRVKVVSGNLAALAGEPFRIGPSGGRIAAPEVETANWQASPNPFEQDLVVTVPTGVEPGQLRVDLHNISGTRQDSAIESTRVEDGKLHVRLPKLQSGLYFLRVYNGDQPLRTLKVLKK